MVSKSKYQYRELAEFGLTNQLQNKVILITGAARGIGEQLAYIVAKLGAKVVLADIALQGQAVADSITDQGGAALFVPTDVGDQASRDRLLGEINQHFGSVDLLVNNAIQSPTGPLHELPVATWQAVLAVNLGGAISLTQRVIPSMIEKGSGVIVNMISAPSMPYLAVYTATKQALESLAHSLAGELGDKGINVVAYGPGMVETPGGLQAFTELADYYGLSLQEMTHSGVNPTYPGLIPAYDSALALAYVLCHHQDYHGQTVLMHEVVAGANWDELQAKEAPKEQELEELITAVIDLLARTEKEFDRLPIFARPMARIGFKRKVHLGVGDLQKKLAHALNSPTKRARDALLYHLAGLVIYFREVPAETRRFVKDEQAMAEITEIANHREERCQALVNYWQAEQGEEGVV